ncbi:MAG TPA: hypothetical protein PKI11_15730 [Candidatus Hydrogenedentes bacterium]|nr:hypothetical protein [Candidatus Hydrogenedentota bacterium]
MMRFDWADRIADLLTRVLYFAGTVVLSAAATVSFVTAAREPDFFQLLILREYWVSVAFFGMLAALFGPGMYRRYRQRGSGSLYEIREHSRLEPPDFLPDAIPADEARRTEDGDV